MENLPFILIFLIIMCCLAYLPGHIAKGKGHKNAEAITVCGFAGIIFPPAWVVALVWAFVE